MYYYQIALSRAVRMGHSFLGKVLLCVVPLRELEQRKSGGWHLPPGVDDGAVADGWGQ